MSTVPGEHLDHTANELTALALLARQRRFPGVGAVLSSSGGTPELDAALRAARLSLIARGVVTVGEDGSVELAETHRTMLRTALRAELFVSAQRTTNRSSEVRLYLVRPQSGVEHRSLRVGIDRLTPFEPDRLMERLLDFVDLRDRPVRGAEPIEGDIADLTGIVSAPSAQPEGVDTRQHAFAELGRSFVSMSTVRVLHGKARLRGGELAWVDAGGAGLWKLSLPLLESEGGIRRPSTRVILRPSSALAIAEDLCAFLPEHSAPD